MLPVSWQFHQDTTNTAFGRLCAKIFFWRTAVRVYEPCLVSDREFLCRQTHSQDNAHRHSICTDQCFHMYEPDDKFPPADITTGAAFDKDCYHSIYPQTCPSCTVSKLCSGRVSNPSAPPSLPPSRLFSHSLSPSVRHYAPASLCFNSLPLQTRLEMLMQYDD